MSGRSGAPSGCAARVERLGAGQGDPARQVVVEEQPRADHPARPHLRPVRQHEAHGPDDVGRDAQQHLALGQRLAHQAELVLFQVAQPAMDQLGGGGGGGAAEVAALHQQTERPRPAASRAMPQPFTPPPTTRRSKVSGMVRRAAGLPLRARRRIARQTRLRRRRHVERATPSGASASSTASTTVCGAAMAPAWPAPLTPSGLDAVGHADEAHGEAAAGRRRAAARSP